jgi:hypothetical protein
LQTVFECEEQVINNSCVGAASVAGAVFINLCAVVWLLKMIGDKSGRVINLCVFVVQTASVIAAKAGIQ